MANDFEAGNLNLTIRGFDDGSVSSINKTVNALNRMQVVIERISTTDFITATIRVENLFKSIAIASQRFDTTSLENFATAMKTIGSLNAVARLDKVDFAKVGKGFNNLAVAIEPFLLKVKEAESSLVALEGVLKRTSGKKIKGLLGGTDTGKKSSFGLLQFGKLGVTYMMMRRLGAFTARLVQAGSDYNEQLNLWQVSMRDNLDVAEQFVSKMQQAYGISTKTLMNAQAIFKNMIGSLGQISEATAYKLSEALVQMSADFSSLYNVQLQKAFEKMQAMLAGQVRPIRSSGLDTTETTLFMYYQQLGGTKTMRQLNRTEKQLLSILAVYKQMGSAGALGDMTKTLNQYANQSRMMVEYWTELKTWTGLVLKDLIDQSGVLVYINAALITVTEIMRSIARSRGLGEDNFINGLFETTEATNDAVDELKGKLLDFDKFRSLEGTSASPLAIDQKLLDAIAGYDSQIDQAQNAARKLADDWLRILGATENENGELVFTGDNLTIIENVLKGIGAIVASIIGYGIYSLLSKVGTAISTVVGSLIKMKSALVATSVSIASAFAGFYAIDGLINMLDEDYRQLASTLSIILGLALAIGGAMKGGLVGASISALGAGAILAGIQNIKIPNYAVGASDIDSGTVFRAGEFGKTEAVFTGSNGKTNVANIQQMKAAYNQALNEWWSRARGDLPQFAEASKTGLYTAVKSEAVRRGDW